MAKPTRIDQQLLDEYRGKGYWTDETMVDKWERCAKEYPDGEALVDGEQRITWSQARQWIDRLAMSFLDKGFIKDDVLVVQLPNCAELALLRVACEKAGILCLPILRTLRHREVAHIISHTQATGIVIPWKFRDFDYYQMVKEINPDLPGLKHIFIVDEKAPQGAVSLREMRRIPIEKKYPHDYLQKTKCPATEFALILHTSGTTGFPKFVEYPVCTLIYQAKTISSEFRINNHDIFGILGPAAAGPNIRAYMCSPLVGAKLVMMDKFEAGEALQLIEKEKITITGLVPTQIAMMLRHPDFNHYDLSSLRLIFSAGSALPYEWGMEMESRTKARVVQLYGSVDWGGGMCSTLSASQAERLQTVGKPYGGNEAKLVNENDQEVPVGEVGEIIVRGPSASSGYYRNPEATWQAWKGGWFHMGDLGRWNEHGNLVIVGRQKEVIIRGGQNIYPAEIEKLLTAHPKVAAAALVGMPDLLMGERACAYVVSKEGQQFAFEEMVSFLKGNNVAPYKLPERLEIVDKLPLVGEQKVDKKALEADIKEKLKAEAKSV